MLNFMSFRFGAGPMGGNSQAGIDLLKEVDAPYFHPYFVSRENCEGNGGKILYRAVVHQRY